jgi:lipoteichoic acid synthase
MDGRLLIAAAIALLGLTPNSIATGATSPAAVAKPMAVTSNISLAGASGETIEGRVEKVRRSSEGSRVATFAVGAYKGKNVVIVQVEALNAFLINKKWGGREITPNLNKLTKESWYWPNAYSQSGMGNTADAEFIVNTSLYAPQGQAAPVKYANRRIPAMPRVLKTLGYDSFTIHPNNVLYWNRRQMYRAIGFHHYYDTLFFKGAPKMGQFGASDQELFKRGVKVMRKLEASGTPFYSQFITLSAHGPFESIPESRRPLRTPKSLSGSLMGKYISAESYSDLAVGEFIKSLKATGLWDNSIIIIYGDHTAMPSNKLTGKDARGAKALLGRDYSAVDRQRIPLIIHLPGQTAPVLRRDVAGQVDIMPTVADLVGANLTHVPRMGRSLFVASSPLVPFNAYLRGGSFVNARVLFGPKKRSLGAVAYWVSNGKSTRPKASETADSARVTRLKKLSESWIMSLPKINAGPRGWIPDKVARRAAKPYGFHQ